MPTKTDPIIVNKENITKAFHAILEAVDINDIKILDKLESDERRDFAKFCHQMFYNPFFDLIIKNFVFAQVMLTAERDWTVNGYDNGKLIVTGAYMVKELVGRFAYIYENEYSPAKENFDPQKVFPQPKI